MSRKKEIKRELRYLNSALETTTEMDLRRSIRGRINALINESEAMKGERK